MAFSPKLDWADGSGGGTPITAAQLIRIEQGIRDASRERVARAVSAALTLALADESDVVQVANTDRNNPLSFTIPANSTVPFPVGGWVDICATGIGRVQLVAASGVSIRGQFLLIEGNYGTARLLKIGTDEWLMVNNIEGDTGWLALTTLPGVTIASGWAEGGDLMRIRRKGNVVYIKCHTVRTSATTSTASGVVFTLPSGWITSQVVWFTWLKYGGVSGEAKFNPDGNFIFGPAVEQNSGFVGAASYILG